MQRVALVTGCSSGFGMYAAVALAKRGFRVCATMRDLGKRAALDGEARGVSLDVRSLDVSKIEEIPSVIERVSRELGPIDVLVNNAGIGLIGAIEETSVSEFREVFDTNFFGPVALTQAVLPSMRERRSGHIINVSSVGGRIATPGVASYSASKFALEGMTEALRLEVASFGVKVCLVEPGMFRTPMISGAKRQRTKQSDGGSAYKRMNDGIEARMEQVHGDAKWGDPRVVGALIARIAGTANPKLRYPVGVDAQVLLRLVPAMPEAMRLAVLGTVFPLPKR